MYGHVHVCAHADAGQRERLIFFFFFYQSQIKAFRKLKRIIAVISFLLASLSISLPSASRVLSVQSNIHSHIKYMTVPTQA